LPNRPVFKVRLRSGVGKERDKTLRKRERACLFMGRSEILRRSKREYTTLPNPFTTSRGKGKKRNY